MSPTKFNFYLKTEITRQAETCVKDCARLKLIKDSTTLRQAKTNIKDYCKKIPV